MSRAFSRKILSSVGMALLLTCSVASVALAVDDASWDATCSAGDICNYKNISYGLPLAATTVDDDDYNLGGDIYPNTSDGINDSVSSMKNRKSANDVFWWTSAGPSGSNFCLNAGFQINTITGLNDRFSSHQIALNTAC